jgi:hypothetical protein
MEQLSDRDGAEDRHCRRRNALPQLTTVGIYLYIRVYASEEEKDRVGSHRQTACYLLPSPAGKQIARPLGKAPCSYGKYRAIRSRSIAERTKQRAIGTTSRLGGMRSDTGESFKY